MPRESCQLTKRNENKHEKIQFQFYLFTLFTRHVRINGTYPVHLISLFRFPFDALFRRLGK